MPTKDDIADALLKHKRVDLAAASLGLGLRRMYRFMERYGLTLKGVLSWHSMPKSGSSDTPASAASVEPTPVYAKPKRDARRLTAADFNGTCLGEVSHATSKPGCADELLDHYHKLRNS